jgi:hypothetical protein
MQKRSLLEAIAAIGIRHCFQKASFWQNHSNPEKSTNPRRPIGYCRWKLNKDSQYFRAKYWKILTCLITSLFEDCEVQFCGYELFFLNWGLSAKLMINKSTLWNFKWFFNWILSKKMFLITNTLASWRFLVQSLEYLNEKLKMINSTLCFEFPLFWLPDYSRFEEYHFFTSFQGLERQLPSGATSNCTPSKEAPNNRKSRTKNSAHMIF